MKQSIDDVLDLDPVGVGDFQCVVDALNARGYRVVKPAPESFKRTINGREAIVIEDEL